MSFLLSLSQDERDSLLSTIIYAEKPRMYYTDLMKANMGALVNYSCIYEALKEQYPLLLNPNRLRTGDCVQTCDYRGVGKRYAIWLRKGIITHDLASIEKFATDIKFGTPVTDEQFDEYSEQQQVYKRPKNFKVLPGLTFASRKEDGPHNDGQHEVYLSVHPDEMGYAPSAVFSSLPATDYFDHLQEWTMNTFDPLITHSQSHYGQIIRFAKESDEFATNSDFPLNYIGKFDSEMGSEQELMWIPMEEANSLDNRCGWPPRYISDIRMLFNNHFDKTTDTVEMKSTRFDYSELK